MRPTVWEIMVAHPRTNVRTRLKITQRVYNRIAEGFDSCTTEYPRSRYVALGRRLREAASAMSTRAA